MDRPSSCRPSMLKLLADDPVDASRIAANLLWRTGTDNRSRLELLLLMALATHRMGDAESSAEMTRRALALYPLTGLLRPFATLDPVDLEALFDLARVREQAPPFRQRITLIQLTPREELLVKALASTASRKQIADDLYVSVNTIRKQLATLYRKLGVSTRAEALARLARLGLPRSRKVTP
jgi:LuxR family maltose regulon positive regulatory protein